MNASYNHSHLQPIAFNVRADLHLLGIVGQGPWSNAPPSPNARFSLVLLQQILFFPLTTPNISYNFLGVSSAGDASLGAVHHEVCYVMRLQS